MPVIIRGEWQAEENCFSFRCQTEKAASHKRGSAPFSDRFLYVHSFLSLTRFGCCSGKSRDDLFGPGFGAFFAHQRPAIVLPARVDAIGEFARPFQCSVGIKFQPPRFLLIATLEVVDEPTLIR